MISSTSNETRWNDEGIYKKMNDNLSNLKRKKGWFKEELANGQSWKELRKNQKLLDELKELNDKIQNELLTKLDKFKKQ
jgi:hypothetical protein